MSTTQSSKNLDLVASEARDSRGRPTVEVVLRLGDVETHGDVPAGASKGEDEARTVDVPTAIRNIHETLLPLLREADVDLRQHSELLRLERRMIEHSGDNFDKLGANATLPVSRALWRAAAKLHGCELHQYIRTHEPEVASDGRVLFYMNIFNGGLHALKDGEELGRERIDIQEIMVVPTAAQTYSDALQAGDKIDAALKKILTDKFGAKALSRGDEAGFTVKGLGDSSEAFAYVFAAVEAAGYTPGKEVKLALDVAASSFFDPSTGNYKLQGKPISTDEMIQYLVGLVDQYPDKVLSVEDGLAENDWEGWTKLSSALHERGVVTIGDDLFVTQMPRLEKGIAIKAAHAILIKVNQNGTVHGTLEVMKRARKADMRSVVSHRSGETLDDSIADLAYATGAMGLKTGDPQPEVDFPAQDTWVRRRKYLRMVEIDGK